MSSTSTSSSSSSSGPLRLATEVEVFIGVKLDGMLGDVYEKGEENQLPTGHQLAVMDDNIDQLIEEHGIIATLDNEVENAVKKVQKPASPHLPSFISSPISSASSSMSSASSSVSSTSSSVSSTRVTLWRGCSFEDANNMVTNRTASGQQRADSQMVRLGNEIPAAEVRAQLSGDYGSVLPEFAAAPVPRKKTESKKDSEDSDSDSAEEENENVNAAKGFSAGNALVSVEIDPRYLQRCSGRQSERGWVCDPYAPVTVKAIIDRRCINVKTVQKEVEKSLPKNNI